MKSQRDGEQKAGVESGTSEKYKCDDSEADLGMDTSNGSMEGKSKANPEKPAARGHTIK